MTDNWTPYEPCPECGAQNEKTFKQVTKQTEQVVLDENGVPEEFVVEGDTVEPAAVACTECDTVIFGDENEFN